MSCGVTPKKRGRGAHRKRLTLAALPEPTLSDQVLCQIGEDWQVVIAVSRCDKAPADLQLQIVFAHRALDFLEADENRTIDIGGERIIAFGRVAN
jgi:hypothetical protein